MEPRIQYAQTNDGVNIAYFSMGEGLPVVFVPPVPWSHLQMELADPGYRRWYEANSRSRRLIRYDNRCSGLSDRRVENMAFEDFLLDIDAVVDKLGLEQFVLCGMVSNVVRELAAGKGFLFSDRGEFVAKGFEDPVRVYEVSWRDANG